MCYPGKLILKYKIKGQLCVYTGNKLYPAGSLEGGRTQEGLSVCTQCISWYTYFIHVKRIKTCVIEKKFANSFFYPVPVMYVVQFPPLSYFTLYLPCTFRQCNGFDLIQVCFISRTPIATPTVVGGDLFFRQGGDQLNGGRSGKVDL